MQSPRHALLLDEDDEKRAPIVRWLDEDRIFCMASLAGNRLVVGGAPAGEITLWDARTGTKEYTLHGHTDSVLALVVVPAHNAIYSAGADSSVRSWSLDTLQNTMVFEGHKGFVVGLFAEGDVDPTTGLFSGSDDRTVKQWNINSGACVHTFRGHKGPVNALVGNGVHLYSGSSDGLLKVWELSTRRCVRTVEAHRDSIWSLCLLPDGRLISGSTDATIKIWEDLTHSTNCVAELNGHRGKIRKLLVQGPILFSAGADSYINVWNLNSANLVETLATHEKQVSGLTLENNQLCSSGFDRVIARWDVTDLLPVKQPIKPFQPLSAVRAKELEMARQKAQEVNSRRNKRKIQGDKTPEEVLAMYKELPVNFVCRAMEYKVQSSYLSLEVLAYLPFLVCFVLVFTVSRPIEENYYMVAGISNALVETTLPSFKQPREFSSVTNPFWFDKWMDLMLRQLWAEPPADANQRPMFMGQNILIGTLRVRQKRVHRSSCTFPAVMIPNQSAILSANTSWGSETLPSPIVMPCYGPLTSDGENKVPFLCPATAPRCAVTNASLAALNMTASGFVFDPNAGTSLVGQLASYDVGGYVVDFPFRMSLAEAQARREAMREVGFVDDVATRLLDISFYTYNPAIDLFLAVRYLYEIPMGGTWIGITREVGFQIFTFRNVGRVVFEVFFFLFVLLFVGIFISDFRAEWRKKRLLGFFFNWWNLMEFANLTIFIVMYAYRWSWMRLSSKVDTANILDSPGFPSELEASQQNYQMQVWFNAVNTVLTFLKFLKYVRLNDRLNVLTRTLAACQQSLIGVLVLFVYVVLGFAVCGNALYGDAIHSYRSLSAAYVSILRQLLGDVDYDRMSTEKREVTVVFYWAVQILCLFILLNFLVAVINDGFADVSESKGVIPLDQAIMKVFNDAKYECLPKTLRLKLQLLRHRTTQTGVVSQTLEVLLEKRRGMVSAAAAQRGDFDELDDTYLHRDDLISLMPVESRTMLTEEFVEEIWKDMSWEYHFHLMGKRGQEEHEKELLVHEEVRQALRPLTNAFPVLEAVTQRLELQEAKLRPFANAVGVSF